MNTVLEFKPFGPLDFEVLSKSNGKEIGLIILDIDGSYYFESDNVKRYWSSYVMKEICNKLDELNVENEQKF
jgi:hypothetical protein